VTNRRGRGIGKRPAKREGHDFQSCRKQRKTVAALAAEVVLETAARHLPAGTYFVTSITWQRRSLFVADQMHASSCRLSTHIAAKESSSFTPLCSCLSIFHLLLTPSEIAL